MIIAFYLTMPGNASWNGKWTGENNLYAKTVKVTKEQGEKILKEDSYLYDFGDGWKACISVKIVAAKEAGEIRRASQGFCGYDWMIDHIIHVGRIIDTSQIQDIVLWSNGFVSVFDQNGEQLEYLQKPFKKAKKIFLAIRLPDNVKYYIGNWGRENSIKWIQINKEQFFNLFWDEE